MPTATTSTVQGWVLGRRDETFGNTQRAAAHETRRSATGGRHDYSDPVMTFFYSICIYEISTSQSTASQSSHQQKLESRALSCSTRIITAPSTRNSSQAGMHVGQRRRGRAKRTQGLISGLVRLKREKSRVTSLNNHFVLRVRLFASGVGAVGPLRALFLRAECTGTATDFAARLLLRAR